MLDCLKHERSLCHECKDVGMCDGQTADNCDFMNLAKFKATLKDQLSKLDDHFSTIHDVLKEKKQAFIEIYRRDPRISHDEALSYLLAANEAFDPLNTEEEQGRKSMENQLVQLQEQLDQQQEQLLQHRDIAAEAEDLRKQLADQNNHIKYFRSELSRQRLAKREWASQASRSRNLVDKIERKNENLASFLNKLELERFNLAQDLQLTQTRLQDAERTTADHTMRIKKLERNHKNANPNRGGPGKLKPQGLFF